jgi:hypothetical protein
MKLYVFKSPPNKLYPKYVVVTYDSETKKLTYIHRPKFFKIPPDHEIFQTSPNFVQQVPDNCLEYNGVTYAPGHTQTVNLNELKASYNWTDHSTYVIGHNPAMSEYTDIFHVESTTLDKRMGLKDYLISINQYISMALFVPFASGDDIGVFMAISDHPENVLITNGDIEVVDITQDSENNPISYLKNLLLPQISTNKPPTMRKDSTETINVQLMKKLTGDPITDRNATVYIDPVVGTVNKTRVDIVNGTGNFVVSSAGLNVGDIIRVKLGWKFWPGASDVFITVVE